MPPGDKQRALRRTRAGPLKARTSARVSVLGQPSQLRLVSGATAPMLADAWPPGACDVQHASAAPSARFGGCTGALRDAMGQSCEYRLLQAIPCNRSPRRRTPFYGQRNHSALARGAAEQLLNSGTKHSSYHHPVYLKPNLARQASASSQQATRLGSLASAVLSLPRLLATADG